MMGLLLFRAVTAMERRWNYDARYIRDVIAVSPWAGLRFLLATSLGHGRRAPREAMAAAALTATLAEDCGPCTQISVDMALDRGVPPAILHAILIGDEAAMGDAAALGYRFARAVLGHDIEGADPVREQIVQRWGPGALVDIGLTITVARMYPTLKYALGHGRSCSRVTVAGEPAAFHAGPGAVAA